MDLTTNGQEELRRKIKMEWKRQLRWDRAKERNDEGEGRNDEGEGRNDERGGRNYRENRCVLRLVELLIYFNSMTTRLGLFYASRRINYFHCMLIITFLFLESFFPCPGYDTKQSDGEVLVLLKFCEMRSSPSLPSLPGPLWDGVIASDTDRVLSIGQI